MLDPDELVEIENRLEKKRGLKEKYIERDKNNQKQKWGTAFSKLMNNLV